MNANSPTGFDGRTGAPLRVGVSACFFHHDPTRPIFKGKRLLYVEESMLQWLMSNGALPVLVPTPHAGISTDEFLSHVDGLLLQGGSDVCPESYGETALRPEWNGDLFRDRYETELIHACMRDDKPVLGICRGHQIINVALGGSLYQDIELQVSGAMVHRDWEVYDQLRHEITIDPNSKLAALYRDYDANAPVIISIHHQAIKDLAPGLSVEARCDVDGIIEAVRLTESPSGDASSVPYVVGVQWHPEFQKAGDGLLPPDPLMREFLQEIGERRRASSDAVGAKK